MHGTLFIWVFFLLAPGIALALLIRFVRRFVREPRRRWAVVGMGTSALGIWVGASWAMSLVVFAAGWDLAHRHPFPPGPVPEGWAIYVLLAVYTTLGAGLLIGVGKLPRPAA